MRENLHYSLVFLSVLTVAGCNSDPGPRAHIESVVPVSGTLTYKGQPLEHFQVTLLPVDGRRAATGISDAEGRFTLGTNAAGDGAPPGSHKVAVVWVGPPTQDAEGQEQILDDPAQLPKPKVKLPAKYSNPDTSGLQLEIPDRGMKDLKIDLQ